MVDKIIIYEATKENDQIILSNRQLHVAQDFPLFETLEPEVREKVLTQGSMALRSEEFSPIYEAVLAAEKTEQTKQAVKEGVGFTLHQGGKKKA